VGDEVWIELEYANGRRLWTDFVERFQFRPDVTAAHWPAIVEPAPSVVWDLSPVFAGACPGGFETGSRAVAGLVLSTLRDCVAERDTVAFHDGVHPSRLLRPHLANDPEDVPGWDTGGLFPNGDYTIFVGRDDAFGLVGHPWEQSLCVFGTAVAAFAAHNRGTLTNVLRRDGQPPH
jgi:hypothetical protein